MSPASAGETRSSASIERIQSCAARSAARFFCWGKPGQPSTKTRAPARRAMSAVASVLPASTTTISSAHATEASAASSRAASFFVMMVTETGSRLTPALYGRSLSGRAAHVQRAERPAAGAAFLHRLELDQRLHVVDDRAQLLEARRRQVALGDQDVDALGQADGELLARGVELPLREDAGR